VVPVSVTAKFCPTSSATSPAQTVNRRPGSTAYVRAIVVPQIGPSGRAGRASTSVAKILHLS
jgi:hypothetical protein